MTEASKPTLPAFDPAELRESNLTNYPAKYRAANRTRYYRRLGDHAGLKNFGVNLIRIIPGGQSAFRHAHSRQDEFGSRPKRESRSKLSVVPANAGPITPGSLGRRCLPPSALDRSRGLGPGVRPRRRDNYADLASAPSIIAIAFCTPYTATNEPKRGPFSWPSRTW